MRARLFPRLLLCLPLLAAGCGRRAGAPRPNILLIGLDTTRADHLGCCNSGRAPAATPALDAFAAGGLRFAAAFTPVPSTLAAFTTVMTGCDPPTHGVPRNGFRIPDSTLMLAERLRDAGYRTAAFIGAYVLHSDHNFHQGFDHFDADFNRGTPGPGVERPAAEVSDAAIAWLAEHGAGNRPFLLFVHYFDPHLPYAAPGAASGLSSSQAAATRQALRAGTPGAAAAAAAAAAAYAAEVAYMDRHVGRLIEALERAGLSGSTLVVVFADHGEMLADREEELYDHGKTVYEPAIRVPLLVRGPGVPAGAVAEGLVSLSDLAPSVCAFAGVPWRGPRDGEALDFRDPAAIAGRPFVCAGGSKPWDPGLEEGEAWINRRKEHCLRTRRWKLIRKCGGGQELYDLEQDPAESRDLHDGNVPPEIDVAALARELEEWAARAPARAGAGGEHADPEVLRRLRSLGYGR